MFKSSIKRFLHIATISLLVCASGTGHADDTEIYFSTGGSGSTSDPVLPNVLFILDTSVSMSYDAGSSGISRLQALKDAMTSVLTNVSDVNVGLMRFNYSSGGSVIFPITYIDESTADVVSEPTEKEFSDRLSDPDDDGEEDTNTNTVSLTDSTLDVTQIAAVTGATNDMGSKIVSNTNHDAEQNASTNAMTNGDSDLDLQSTTISAIRFTSLAIPAGSTINSAFIDLTIRTQQGGTPPTNTLTLAVELTDDAPSIGTGVGDISSRDFSTTTVSWPITTNPAANTMITSPDVKTLVQTIVSRAGWNTGQDIIFRLLSSVTATKREVYTYDGTTTSSRRPTLRVNYTEATIAGKNNVVALRFPAVNIPQGATITEANIQFTPQASNSASTIWTIKAEASDNSPELAATASNLSARTTTSESVDWDVPSWASATSTSPDLADVMQEVTDRTNWCGGKAMTFVITGSSGLRRAKSVEQASSSAPLLTYTYDLASAVGGCTTASVLSQAANSLDDAEQTLSDGTMNRTSIDLDFASTTDVGVRFPNVNVPQGATIDSATIEFTASEAGSGSFTKTISGQDSTDAAQFLTTTNDLTTGRAKVTPTATWTSSTAWVDNTAYSTSDIKTIVQDIVDDGSWETGNAMAFFVTGSGTRAADSYNGNAQNAPRLRITYTSEAEDEIKTARARMIELVDDLSASDYTPTVEAMYEAALYWRGEDVLFGLSRFSRAGSRISHAGTYCEGENDCGGADTSGFPDFGVDRDSSCDILADPGSSDCASEHIEGSPTYIAPFKSELSCQKNYQVLLTDGLANDTSTVVDEIEDNYLVDETCDLTNSEDEDLDADEICGADLAEFMFLEDQNDDLENDQNVITYTIAFNLSDAHTVRWLKDIAMRGSGGADGDGFYSTDNAEGLVNAFSQILTDVKKDPTSFVAPSLATNAFNRLLSRDEVYFGLFTPSLETRWFGNVKKYRICIDSDGADPESDTDDCVLGEILDNDNESAVDATDNKFKTNATSVWSDVVDGQATTKGGAGGEITDYEDRIIYSDTTASGTAPTGGTELDFATNPGYQIDFNTWNDTETDAVRDLVCPNSADISADSDCEKRMLWMLGKIVDPDSENDASTANETRWSVNDVLHSSPVVITYGGDDTDDDGVIDTFFDKLVVGTNEGGLRLINGTTGAEEWTFMPQAVMSNQQQLFSNPETDHIYGLDLTPTLQLKDNDRDGIIEPTASPADFVRVFNGMRLGGRFIYALDVTEDIDSTSDTVIPKFLWRIQGGTGDFTRLGDTFSQPRLATIFIETAGVPVKTDVLIFGGGYDQALDSGFSEVTSDGNDENDPNHLGNALYIVNPANGARILSITGDDSSTADIEVEAMHYSVASRITVLDSDGDGVDDRVYFGDTGGQVWRVDLGADIEASGTSRAGSTVVGRLANLSVGGGDGSDERRFFEPPSVVQVKDTLYSDATGGEYDYVLIGSGWRAHPLDKAVDDRFYALRDKNIGTMVDANSDNLADNYPLGTPGTAPSPIVNTADGTDLIDITEIVLDSDETDHTQSLGWYLDFTLSGNDGEKVLSAPITIANTVFFTTYLPDAVSNVDQCSAQIGGGNAYNIGILNAGATIDWDLDDTVEGVGDRAISLGGGIPSDVVPVFTKEGIVGIVGIEGGAAQLGTLSGLPRFQTYWYEESGS